MKKAKKEDFIVASTKKSEQNQALTLVLPSEKGVVQDSILIGKKLYPPSTGLKVASIIIASLTSNMYSGDALWLSFHSAESWVKDVCPEISEKDRQEMINYFYKVSQAIRKGNPISGMF